MMCTLVYLHDCGNGAYVGACMPEKQGQTVYHRGALSCLVCENSERRSGNTSHPHLSVSLHVNTHAKYHKGNGINWA